MATSTAVVSCTDGAYTAIGTGVTACRFRVKEMIKTIRCRMVIAGSAPAVSETGFIEINDDEWFDLTGISASLNVYLMPIGAAAVVEVIKT